MAELLPIGTSAAQSADFTLAAGGNAIIHLYDAAGPSLGAGISVLIQIKVGTEYFTMYELTSTVVGTVMSGGDSVTIWRINRAASASPSGVLRV